MQTQFKSGISNYKNIFTGFLFTGVFLILIIFLFLSSLKSSTIFEKLLDDIYMIEFDLLTQCKVGKDTNSRIIDKKHLKNTLKILETGVLKYTMIFSESDKRIVKNLYFLLNKNSDNGGDDLVVFTTGEFNEIQQGIRQLRQILLVSSWEQKRSLSYIFILLLLLIVILLFVLISAATSIDKEKRKHQYHRQLTKSISESENRIHNNLSSELHDDIGQMLVFLKLKLVEANSALSKDIDPIIDSVRNLSHNLKIPKFSRGQFTKSVEEIISQFSTISSIRVEYTLSDFHNELYPDYYQIIIFRLIQECLQNAVKHSNAKNIRINLVESAPYLIFRYKDDGIGIDITDNPVVLKSIEGRVKLLNAELNIDTKIDRGLYIVVKIPFVKEID